MKKFFQNKIKLLISLTFLILFVFNTVAYSGLATKLAITSEAKFRPITDIRVTDIKLDSATNGAVESYSPKFNVDTTTTGFVLPNVNSTITYKVKVTNYGNVNQTIYNFIKNSINSSNVNIKITDFTSVCADDSCSQKNSDFTIIHHNGDNTTDSNEKEILITFSTSAPSDQAINVIEKYDFRPIYNINYDANGGQNAPKSQIKIYKDNLTLTTDEPTRPSYKFLGWSTSSKSTTAEYKAGDSYNPGTNEEVKDIILYAVWKIDSYTLTINPNGGTWNNSTNKSTITQSYGSTYIIENPTKTGYTFTGWTLSGKGSLNGTTYTFGEGAATLTANYTANTYTITLDNKSATTAGTTAIYEKYGAGIYLDSALKNVMTTTTNKITVPAKTGYTFKGYYTKENGQGDQIINENGYITDKITSTTYTANTTLYAYWIDNIAPEITELINTSNGNWTNQTIGITVKATDLGSGIKRFDYSYDNKNWVTTWTNGTITDITNGKQRYDTWAAERNEPNTYFRVIDNAGNISASKKTSIRIDKTAPKIELNGPASSSEINNSNNVTIPIKITETASGINNSEFTASDVSVLINGTTVNPSTKTLTYNSVSNGVYSYTLTLSGITLNGKISLEIAVGAVKDIATNSNSKTTLDPSITVSNIYTISLNGNGTPAIYEKYNTGIYLDSALTSAMTTSANPITKPIRSYTVSFNANNTGITMPSAITKSYSYSGHYTDATAGTQMINENGYITSSFTKTSYTANATLYAHWKAKPSVTIPSISKTGYTCSWNTSADGKGTTYNAGDVTDKLNTQTLYAVCKANSYTVSYNSNGGSGTMTNDTATYDSNFITKKNTFTKTGYTFNGWNEKADGTGTVWGLTTSGVYESGKTWKWTYTKNITLYAQWKANTNTKYVVKHYKQKLDGTYPSEADDTDNLTGTADSSVSPAIKSYAGFTAPSVQTVTISADGSTVVTYKYTRNKYTFTLGSTTGITTTGSTSSGSYYYGSTITLKASANTGYIFTGWTSSNTNLVANQTNASATFTMPVGNITMTPSTGYVSYTVTYDATTNGGSTAKQTASTKYKSLVDLTKKAEKSGYEFVGWNINKDATSALSSYEMPAKNVTLYAIYKKTLTATFNYYNSKSEPRSVTIYNNATSGSITSPAALGTPSGYTFRHYSTSSVANAAKTIDANSAVVLTSNQTYYASYQKNVTAKIYYSTLTANDYIYSGASQTSVDVTAVKYLGYTGVEVDSTYTVPTAVTSSTGGASAEKYIGVSNKVSDATVITPTTANTSYYAVYTESITFHYYNGTAHTKTTLTRRMLSNGSSYSNSLSGSEPVVGNYDGASKTAWSYDPNHYESSYIRTSLATGTNNLYAIYTKSVTSTFNYYDGSKAATTTVSSNKYYVSKDSGINTFNTNITIPDAAKANRGSYTYRGISTSNAANASVVTPTTANTTYYSSYTYAITANFTANGGTGTAPSSAAGTGYMNYSGSKIGISVTMPSNTFTRNGYTFGGWYDSVVNKTYTAGTSVTVDSSRNFNATWNVVTYTIKYNLNGGTVSATNPTSYKATDADITLNNPTKQGYTFTGWTGTGLSEASKAVTIKSGSYGNREYTANYSINQYYYDVNPDSGIKSFDITIDGKTSTGLTDYNQKHNYGTEATITNVVAKPGYTYTGYKVTGSMTTLTGSTNSNIKTKLGTGNGYIALTSTAKTLKFDAQTLASIKYSTTPQALVFEGASNGTGSYSYAITAGNTNGYFNINGTTITTSDKVIPPVGTYKLTVQAIDNTSKVTATADITIVIEKAGSTNPTLTAYSGTYDGQSHTISVSGGSGGTIHYSTDQKTWSTTKPTRMAQGTTTVYVKVVGDSNHTDTGVISSTITIKPATITYTASSYEGFYDGNSHTISVSVTKPTSGATITYSLTENGTYSATKPTVTNATTTPVTVYFKISASNYNTVSSKATITINKTNSVSPTLTAYSGTYDGKPHTIGVTGGSGGTIKYSTDQTNWSTTLPTRTDATTTPVTVYVKVFGDGNHKDTSIISSTITINKKTDVITMSSISTNYTGQKVEATATAESKTTITYTYYNGTTCSGTALSSAPVNVGDYSVKATSTGNNNYKSNSACATIKISNTNNPTTVSAVAGLKYGSTGNLVTTSNVQGTIYYSIGTELTSSNYKTSGSTSIPTASGKNAGTYKVYYYVDATGTNYESTKGGPVSVTIGKALGSISYATKSVTKDYGNASFVNTLTKTGDGIVGYSSSNTGVATIDASGKVTIIAAGTTTITAKVTDGTNYTYSTKTATYTLVVNKIENTAKVSPVTGIIYGEEKSMVSTTGVQGTIYYSVGTVLTESNYLSVGSVTIPTSKGRNAGTYNIYYYVTGNSNYNAAANDSSNPVAVVIGKKQDVVNITEKSATYTGSAIGANTATATSGTGITYTYYSSQDCSGTALSGAPINKGNYSVKATSAGNSNYTSGSKCVKHTIDFGTPTISLGDTTKTYTGSPITSVGAIGKNPNGSSVSLNYTYTYYNGTTCSGTAISAPVNYNANNYSVKATSTATSNLKSATSNCAKLTINKAAGSISYGTKSVTKTYGDAAFTNALTKTGDGSVSYASSNTNIATVDGTGKVSIKAAGTTTITATVTDGNNYTYATKTASYTLNIGKKQDVVTIAEKSATYTGSAIAANTATATSGTGITYTYYSSQDCSGTALSGAPINKGNYSVKATSAGNSNYTSGSKCVKHTIDFGTPTISLGDTTKTYTGSPITSVGAIGKNPNGSSVSLNYTYTYYNGTTCSGTAISAPVNYNANNYSVKATSTATSNLKSATSNCAKLTINKAAGSISYGTKSVTKTYGDAAFTNALTKTGDGSVSYASSNTNIATVDGTGKVSIKAAGTTTITATVTDGNNYTYATKTATYTLTVNAKVITITFNLNNAPGMILSGSTSEVNTNQKVTCLMSSGSTCSITSPKISAPSATPTVVGWNTNANGTISEWNENASKAVSSDATYYAITKKDSSTYAALISANGGGTLSSTTRVYCMLPITYNGAVQPTSCEVTMPTITTASTITPTFVGWNTTSGATTNNSSYNKTTNKLTLSSSNSSQTWYLITTNNPITYTAKVNGNNSTLSSTSDLSCTIASTYNGKAQATSCRVTMPTITAPSATPTVVGWNTSADATTDISGYASSGTSLGLTSSNTGKTWYAITKKSSVIYSAKINTNNGGTLSSTASLSCTIAETYNGKAQATSCEVTMPTITTASSVTPIFVGWNTSSSATTNNSSYNKTTNKLTLSSSNASKTWYLITTNNPITYTAKVNGNNSTLSSTSDLSCTIASTYNGKAQATSCRVTMPTITAPSATPTVVGWNTSADATTDISGYASSGTSLGLTSSNTGKTWYAITKKSSVIYSAKINTNNGGTLSSTASLSCTIAETYNGKAQATSCEVTMPTITTASSVTPIFVGWNTSSSATTNNSSYNKTTNKLTLLSSNSSQTWYLITTNNPITYTAKVNGNNSTLSSTSDLSCTIASTYNGKAQATSCRVTMPTITAPSATPTVVGWNTSATATTDISGYSSSGTNLTLTSSNTGKTWYAITRKNLVTYTASISTNGGGTLSSTASLSCTIAETYNGKAQATSCEVTMPTITTASSVTPNFVGWNTDKTATTNYSSYNKTTNKLTLSSSNASKTWYLITTNNPITYTAKVNGNNSTLSSTSDLSCTIASTYNGKAQATSCRVTMPTITAPSATPTVVGWNTSADATTDISGYASSGTSLGLTSSNTGKTWYAITKKDSSTYTASISANNGGTLSSTTRVYCMLPITYNGAVQPTSCEVAMPTITAASSITPTFVGWNTTSGATTNNSNYNKTTNKLTLSSSNASKTWYLITTNSPITYTGKVNSNGTTLSSTNDVSCTIASTYNGKAQATNCTTTMPSVQKTGYKLVGWNTSASATTNNTSYTLSTNKLTLSSDNNNSTWYPICTPNKYKVKFEPNGGTSSATEMDVTYDSPYGTLPTVTRSASKVNDITINYVFEGWYDSNGTKITETSIVETPSDHTLYAHWLSSPNIKGGTAESWSSTAITISLNIPSTSDTGTVSYQYYLSETNELPESATWTDITSADGSVSISKNGEFYIFYKATSSAGVSITSNYNKLQIDTQTPSTSITAYQAGTTTTVASNKWINKNLEFKMGALNVGPSSGSIYYCIGDNCTPNTLISPNTAIPADLTNTKTGIYKVRYKAVSNAGLSSSIGEYVAKVDKTAPTMKAVVKSLKDNSTLANLTNSSTTYIDSTWRSYGYSINLNGTTDSQSGISSIERFTNANNLKRADADYKANLHKGVITDTKTFSESGDGAKYAKFVATDNAGNTATFTVEVLIDKTAPTVGVNIYKAKDASTKTGSVICALPTSLSNGCKDAFPWTSYGYYFDLSSSSDALSGIDHYTMRYTAGGKSSVDTSSYEERTVHTAYTTVTSSGARRLEFTATDKAGNTSTVEAKNVYIDMDDPNLVIKLYKADSSGNKTGSVLKTITDNNTAINSWTNYRHYFDLSGSSDSLSGIEKITMQINDSGIVTTGNTATGTSDLKTTYTITSTKHQVVGSSGNRYARFTITDKVGNTSVKNVRIYIDLDAPTLNSASLSPQFQSSTTIKYTCSDKTSGFASFGTKTLSKTYTKNVTSSNSPVKIQCKDTAGNTSSGTRTYTWSANSDKCGTTTEDVYSNGYYCDAGNAASANSSACISYATNTGKTTKYVNKRCMYYCNAKTGTTTVAKTCWHQ